MTAAKNKNGYIQADITRLSQYNDFVEKNGLGEYKLTIVASAPGYLDSDPSQEATFINGYPITFNVTNCTYSPLDTMVAAFEPTAFTFDYDKGYFAPASVTVNNATGNWNQGTNELVITNPDGAGDVTVTIEAVQKTYDIKYALTNLTAADSNPTTITSAATGVELTISGTTYYALPTSITVSGVATGDWSYDRATGKITLSYPTDTVTITAVGVEISETINGIWSWNTTIPDGVWTEQAVNFTSNGRTFAGMRWDGYDLYYYVDNTGYNEFKVYSLNKDTQVGTWADGGERSYWRIVDFGTTGETVSKIFADYVSTNAVLSGKLATPTGVQVADGEASWNEVENAAQYEIVVDNASWGTYVPAVYDYTYDESTGVLTLSDAPYEQNGDTVTITDDSTVIVTKAVKGDLITIEDKQYRVLKTEGTVAEVLAMDAERSISTTKNSQVYAGNAFDTYCNEEFYNSLSTNMKNAIIEKTFNQDSWYYNEGTSSGSGNPIYRGVYGTTNYWLGLQTMAFGSSIMRKCYLLSIQDIIDYLGVTSDMTVDNTTLTNENLWKMFWNPATDTHAYGGGVRLRSNYVTSSKNYAFYINMEQGNLHNGQGWWISGVVPAFQIDLSKISWSK